MNPFLPNKAREYLQGYLNIIGEYESKFLKFLKDNLRSDLGQELSFEGKKMSLRLLIAHFYYLHQKQTINTALLIKLQPWHHRELKAGLKTAENILRELDIPHEPMGEKIIQWINE